MKKEVDFPYCIINGEMYQLEMVNDVIRFPDLENDEGTNWNSLNMDYISGRISVMDLFSRYAESGSSYYMVEGKFQKFGTNSHSCKKGEHLNMILKSGDPKVDEQYNYTDVEKAILNVNEDLREMIDEGIFETQTPKEAIKLLEGYIDRLKNV